MAHLCPDCGELCMCQGDTSRIVLDGNEQVATCEHCGALESLVDEHPEAFDDVDGDVEE